MSSVCFQPGILAPLSAFGRSLSFRLKPSVDPRPALRRLQDAFDPSWGVVGWGEPLVRSLGASIAGLRTFPSLSGPGCSVPSTQQALWILLRAEERSATFDRSQDVLAMLEEAFEPVDALDTFQYQGGRDLTGYEDGTENPSPEDSVQVAIIGSEALNLAGSSFVAVQRWQHDLQSFHAHTRQECDAMIGRQRDSNEEIDDAPDSAHVKRSAQESFDPEAFLVRRSMPWVSGDRQGLEFISYGRSLDAFEQILRRMVGLEDDIVDALFRFSKPLTGGYYWCPPIASGRLNFGDLSSGVGDQ
jgi:porphyrinogen peroxidase